MLKENNMNKRLIKRIILWLLLFLIILQNAGQSKIRAFNSPSSKVVKSESFYTYASSYKRNSYSETNIDIPSLKEIYEVKLLENADIIPNLAGQWAIQSANYIYLVLPGGIMRIEKENGESTYLELADEDDKTALFFSSACYDKRNGVLLLECFESKKHGSFVEIIDEEKFIEKKRILGYSGFYTTGVAVIKDNIVAISSDGDKNEIRRIPLPKCEDYDSFFVSPTGEFPMYLTASDTGEMIFLTSTKRKDQSKIETYIFRAIKWNNKEILWETEIDAEERYPIYNPILSGNYLIVSSALINKSSLEIFGIEINSGEIKWRKYISDYELYPSSFPIITATEDSVTIAATVYDSAFKSTLGKIFIFNSNNGEIRRVYILLEKPTFIVGSRKYIICTLDSTPRLFIINRYTGNIEYYREFTNEYFISLPPIFDSSGIYLFLENKKGNNELILKKFSSK